MKILSNLKIIFIGTPGFSAEVLGALIENNFNIISVYTQGDKKVGRSQEFQKSAVKKIAQIYNIKVFDPKKFSEDAISELKNQNPDLIIVSAYGKILPKTVLEIPKYGIINTHPSILPKYRGASPIQNAILNGEKETAAAIMILEEKVDAGGILSMEKVKIGENETYPELSKRLSKISAELLVKIIPLWIEGKIKPVKQDESKATFCQMIKKEDGKIDWKNEARAVYNCFRAFVLWPGIFSYWKKEKQVLRLKLEKISLDENETENNFEIGKIFLENGKIKVKTGKGNIILEEVQLEGKNKIGIAEFVRGYPKFIGSVLE